MKKAKKIKTYSRRDSLVVTDPTTNLPIRGLIQDERTGIHALLCLWPYVIEIMTAWYIYYQLNLESESRAFRIELSILLYAIRRDIVKNGLYCWELHQNDELTFRRTNLLSDLPLKMPNVSSPAFPSSQRQDYRHKILQDTTNTWTTMLYRIRATSLLVSIGRSCK